jgi:hypothetical protein
VQHVGTTEKGLGFGPPLTFKKGFTMKIDPKTHQRVAPENKEQAKKDNKTKDEEKKK